MKIIFKALAFLFMIPFLFTSCTVADAASGENVVMRATVREVLDKILVEVIESEYAFGPYLVITSPNTEYLDKDGNPTTRLAIKEGQTLTIHYGGQVMMSLPPQIVAKRIVIEN